MIIDIVAYIQENSGPVAFDTVEVSCSTFEEFYDKYMDFVEKIESLKQWEKVGYLHIYLCEDNPKSDINEESRTLLKKWRHEAADKIIAKELEDE